MGQTLLRFPNWNLSISFIDKNDRVEYLTIGSCVSVHYRVMEHVGSLESTKEASSASFKNSSPREKVAKSSSFWDWWAEPLFVSIIVAKRFAHAINVHHRDFEHAYVY